MQPRPIEILTKVCSEVLANLVFLFTEDAEPEVPTEDRWLETTIGYFGPGGGRLGLLCPRGFAVLLAENLVGTHTRDGASQSGADDAVKEFMNIVCGQFITAAHGTGDVYNLTIPQVREHDEEPSGSGPQESTTALNVEGHRIVLWYEATAPAAVC